MATSAGQPSCKQCLCRPTLPIMQPAPGNSQTFPTVHPAQLTQFMGSATARHPEVLHQTQYPIANQQPSISRTPSRSKHRLCCPSLCTTTAHSPTDQPATSPTGMETNVLQTPNHAMAAPIPITQPYHHQYQLLCTHHTESLDNIFSSMEDLQLTLTPPPLTLHTVTNHNYISQYNSYFTRPTMAYYYDP